MATNNPKDCVELKYHGGGPQMADISVSGKPLIGVSRIELVLDCSSKVTPVMKLDVVDFKLDAKAESMIRRVTNARIAELEAAIRGHRAATVEHRMCWENDNELWRVLGDKDEIDHRPPNWLSFIWNCLKYRYSRRGQKCPCGTAKTYCISGKAYTQQELDQARASLDPAAFKREYQGSFVSRSIDPDNGLHQDDGPIEEDVDCP